MVYNFFFDKRSSNTHRGTGINSDVISENKHPSDLAEELHKRIIRKFEQRKVYSSFKDNICGADLADM